MEQVSSHFCARGSPASHRGPLYYSRESLRNAARWQRQRPRDSIASLLHCRARARSYRLGRKSRWLSSSARPSAAFRWPATRPNLGLAPAPAVATTSSAPNRPSSSLSAMLESCKLKMALGRAEGGTSFGLWQTLPGSNVSRVLARTPGVDWVMVDCEHGNIDGTSGIPSLSTAAPPRPPPPPPPWRLEQRTDKPGNSQQTPPCTRQSQPSLAAEPVRLFACPTCRGG